MNKLAILSMICMICVLLGGVGAFVYLQTAQEQPVPQEEPEGEGEQILLTDPAPLAEGLDSPILQDVERVPLDADKVVNWEKYAERYKGDINRCLNRDSKEFFTTFHLSLDGVKGVWIVTDEHGRSVYRMRSDSADLRFDMEGNLVYLNGGDTPDPAEVGYAYKSEADIEEILASIEDIWGISGEYERTCEYQTDADSYDYFLVRWEKEENPFEYFIADISAVDGSVFYFKRVTDVYEPNAVKPLVTAEQALAFAKPVIEGWEQPSLQNGYDTTEPSLRYVRPNFFWEEGGPYEDATFIRLAWRFFVSSPGSEGHIGSIYVDARTGEILGGETGAYR